MIFFAFFLALWASSSSYPITPSPSYLTPKLYDLELSISDDGSFSGVVKIVFKTEASQDKKDNIVLNSENLDIINAFIRHKGGKEETITDFQINKTSNVLDLSLKQPLENDTNSELILSFTGKPSLDRHGFFKLDQLDGYFMTNFYPIYARRLFPCFDSIEKKAIFNLVLDTKSKFVVSNTVVENTQNLDGGRTRYYFKPTPRIPINRLFIMTGPRAFDRYNAEFKWGKTNIYLHPNFNLFELFTEVISIADSPLLSGLWKVSGQEKLDVIVVPDLDEKFYSGYGVVVLRSDVVRFELSESTTEMHREAALTFLEALLQVYFGSVVSPVNFQKNWLSSSVSKYLRYMAFNTAENWGDLDGYMLQDVHLETLKTSWDINSDPVMLTGEFKDTLDLINFTSGSSVTKGAAVLSMLETFSTKDDIVQTFINFVDKYQYGDPITELDLFIILQNFLKEAKIDVEKFMNPWITQSGFPMIELSRNGVIVDLKETRYLKDNTRDDINWILPVSYSTMSRLFNASNLTPVWFLGVVNAIKIPDNVNPDDFIVLDIDGKAPIVVSYDDQTLKTNGDVLLKEPDLLSPSTRAKLIDDSFRRANAGQANYTLVLNMLRYLDNETSLIPWRTAIRRFKEMYSWIFFTNDNSTGIPNIINLLPDFQTFVFNRMNNIYNKLGFDRNDNSRENDTLRREIVSAMCYFGYKPCLNQTAQLYKKMTQKIDPYVPPNDMKSVLICAGMRNAGMKEWNQFYKTLYDVRLSGELLDIHLDVLSCPAAVKDTSTAIRSYLQTIFSESGFLKDKISTAFNAIYTKAEHINQAIYFFTVRNREIIMDTKQQAQLLMDITPYLSTSYHESLLKAFGEIHKADKELLHAVDLGLLAIQNKLKFIENQMYDVQRGLVGPGPTPTPTPTPIPTTTSTTQSPTQPSSSTSTTTTPGPGPAPPQPSPTPTDEGGLSAATIALISVGVIAVIVVIALVLFCAVRRNQL